MMKEKVNKENLLLGKFIRNKRKEKEMSQRKMCHLINMSVQGYSNIENGRSNPKASIILKIICALDITLDEIKCLIKWDDYDSN